MIGILFLLIIFDQYTKKIINKRILIGERTPLVKKFIYVTHEENTGIALSLFKNRGSWIIPLVGIMELGIVYSFFYFKSSILRLSLILILGGGTSNLIDRIRKGSITDFVQFRIGKLWSPIFNFADFFVIAGAIIFSMFL